MTSHVLAAPAFDISVLSEPHLRALVSLFGAAASAHDLDAQLGLAADGARQALGVD